MYDSTLVPKFYKMNPATDELLPDGTRLANGMVVLLSSPDFRVRIENPMDDWELARALENNRWCTVSNVRVMDGHGNKIVSFIATYEDGTQSKKTYDTSYSWLAKKDSISIAEIAKTERYRALHSMVSDLLGSTPPASEFFDDQVEEITQQMLRMFS